LERLCPALAAKSLVIEKTRHPREKICGGALTLNAERILQYLDIPLNVPSAPVHHVRLVYGDAEINLPENGCAKRVIRRCELDHLIFDAVRKRQIPIIEGLRVTKVIRRPDHLYVQTERGYFRAQVVVSADGVVATLRKTPGFGPGKMARLWVAEIPVDRSSSPAFGDQVLLIDLSYVGDGLKGYYWEFPCFIDGQPFLSTGIVDSNRDRHSLVGSTKFLTEILRRRGLDAEGVRRKAFPIRHFNPSERFARPRMLLVGDALGSDPLFSEGISQGLEMGRLAAEAIVDAFQRNDLSFSRYTGDIRHSRVGKELAAYSRAARFFYGPHSEFLLAMLYQSAELRTLIGCSYAGTQNIHRSTLHLAKLLAGHLIHAKQRVREFRKTAGVGSSHQLVLADKD